MDAIILAGGKGSRLDGVMPPYLKPILPISGKPLICRLFDQVKPMISGRVIIVVAPENALQISQILGNRKALLVVQRNAKGPGDALELALSVSMWQDDAVVLMGDNLMPSENIADCIAQDSWAVGYDVVDFESSKRFTRIMADESTTPQTVVFEEGPEVTQIRTTAMVWSGPLVLPVEFTRTALQQRMVEDIDLGEHKIGPHLNKLVNSCGNPSLVKCQNVDIGIPEAIVQVTT